VKEARSIICKRIGAARHIIMARDVAMHTLMYPKQTQEMRGHLVRGSASFSLPIQRGHIIFFTQNGSLPNVVGVA
jgi:hypothetical protein